MSVEMRKKRKVESAEDREERLKRDPQKEIEDRAAADEAVHAMIKRNIEQHGP
jgi:hypothetical protein